MEEQDEESSKEIKDLQRLQARAVLYATPETLVTAREFARVMAIRSLRGDMLKPPGLVLVGQSKRAPFSAWLRQLDLPQPHPDPDRPSLAELRRVDR